MAAIGSGVRNGTAAAMLTLLAAGSACASLAGTGAPAAADRPAAAQQMQPAETPTIAQRAAGLERRDGYIPFYYDDTEGKLLLEVSRLEEDFLYLNSLATGIGSNRLGLDRGEIGDEGVVRFERHGPKVLLVAQHPGFRATTENAALERSVDESFALSVLGAFPIVAEDADGTVLVEATDFFIRDAFDVTAAIRSRDQGSFRLDRDRSVIYEPRTKAFPDNTEVEALLTFASDNPGFEIRRHTPDGRSLSLRQHHSFVRLPDDGYEPRAFDPRVGLFPVSFYDFSQPLEEGYERHWISRHRLQKRNPDAGISEPVEPIVYYLDPAIPEPYRTAFEQGAGWWNEVFEAAGFRNAYQVRDMPPDMDPLDARYNVIQWVHRTRAGSSIGPSFVDPRTGEIIKAAVRMDSHRSLVDYNLWAGARPAVAGMFQGAGAAAGTGDRHLRGGAAAAGPASHLHGGIDGCALVDAGAGEWIAELDPQVSGEEFAMARRRQHAAHETGHTLGLAHNFIAASYGRASVMDYPAPLIQRRSDGSIDLTTAYRPGPGSYDSLAIRYAYTEFPTEAAERRGLDAIVREGIELGIRFITGGDASASGSLPAATQWVNGGSDMVAELDRVMDVRRALLDRFSAAAIRSGEPMWLLNERLGPVYLHHTYTIEGATKTIGGMDYSYALKGDGQTPTEIVPAAQQWAALDQLVAALQPRELAIPESVVALLAPEPFVLGDERSTLRSPTGPAFDPLAAARTLSHKIVDGVLHRQRAARVVSFHARDPELPSLSEVIVRLVDGTWGTPMRGDGQQAALRRVAARAVVDRLIGLAADPRATVEVRATAEWELAKLADEIEGRRTGDPAEDAFTALAARDIRRFLERRDDATPRSEALPPPPDSPIGQKRDGGS